MRILTLMLLVLAAVGCRTSTVVHRPYSEVRAAIVTMEQRIDSKKHAFTDAEATAREVEPGRCYELYICEFVEKPFWPYTVLRATATSTDSTSIAVSSKQAGLIFDSRRPEKEKQRLQELLEILQ